jgi:capsid protein
MGIVKNLNSKSGIVRNNYTGAKQNRLTNDWVLSAKTADEILKADLNTLRERSRDLERNNDYVYKFFRLLEVNVIGPQGVKVSNRAKLADGTFDTITNDLINREFKKLSK